MSNRAKAIMADYRRRQLATEQAVITEPFLDHRVYPHGWSYAMIERESARRYQSVRDVERTQDWEWCVDTIRRHLSHAGYEAAQDFYHHRQAGLGDTERVEEVGARQQRQAFGWLWARNRSAAIAGAALAHVAHHPDITPMRLATFDAVFDYRQPTLEWVRLHGRPGGIRYNAKDKAVSMNQRETITRIQWCIEVLADHFATITRGYGSAA